MIRIAVRVSMRDVDGQGCITTFFPYFVFAGNFLEGEGGRRERRKALGMGRRGRKKVLAMGREVERKKIKKNER